MYIAEIHVTLKEGILDPQGKTVHHALQNLGFESIDEVRMGKLIRLSFKNDTKEAAIRITNEACKKLLANPVIEDYKYELIEV
ncbi:phosphoribosylformylglycinamidine synthase subunit PurS [candidate division KSB1 bacterium]|nr:phosphoribosylformylglycinamidine synthase subunit PurS [candidate division KSB1 bacterium]NIR70147.1 phosphoribosylformylglycinamidine synthase subunit PurS [candidate division KSB1 bacterium]NIS28059.1 phosphoribosylformylglycinamidine synthase subunit PurS [candidate division KSB1 bacterium]NIT74928.1 phosphoribosylformylglycinamidine synthase subunit PurS [candidate division KSB1 bacterium]NIU28712.1 phosphoribosylformylglycinamidine synthase subunit PurS [candidate division KSB1 bacteri